MFQWFEQRIQPFPSDLPSSYPNRVLAFIFLCTRGIRPYLLLLAILTAGVAIFEALLFQFLSQVVDFIKDYTPHVFWQQHATTLVVIGAVLLLSPLLMFAQSVIHHQSLMGNFPMRLRWQFHQKMLQQSMSFYQNEFSGRISAKVLQTALAVRDVVMIFVNIIIYVLVYFASILLVVGTFHPAMLLPFILWILLFIGMNLYFVPKLSQVSQSQADARSHMTGRITDAYTNIGTIKLFSHARAEAQYAKESMQLFLDPVHQQMRLVTQFITSDFTLSIWTILSTAALAIYLWTQEAMGVGAVAGSIAFALRLNGISRWMMWEMSLLFEHLGTVKDGLNMLSQPIPNLDPPQAPALVVEQGKIELNQIAFAYNDHHPIFQDLHLTIQPGEKIGLVGPSGAGKSTLIHLLLKFYQPQQGQIRIDGQNIQEYSQDSLRAQIGVVSQDTSLLHRNIFDNIAYGHPQATRDEVIAAARQAHAHEFIEMLIDAEGRTGYEVMVGERGLKLSGGQRQRIAIARVMLKNAPILILDEATSALDSEVEQAIQESFEALMHNKTVIAIAHRLSTIAAMDRLIVLHEGKIVEQGSHQELLAHNGVYARLWQRQSGGFLAEDIGS